MKVEGYCIYCGKEQLETAYWYREQTYFVFYRKRRALKWMDENLPMPE